LGAFAGFCVHVLLVQKSLMKLKGTHFEPKVQRPANTAFWWGFFLFDIDGEPQSPVIRLREMMFASILNFKLF